MPKIVITAFVIMSAFNTISDTIRNIAEARNALARICTVELPSIWQSTTNADSKMFSQRMEEMRNDVNQMISALDEYTALLQRSAKDYGDTQESAHSRATSLRSPTNR